MYTFTKKFNHKKGFIKLSGTLRFTPSIIKDEILSIKRASGQKKMKVPDFLGICFVGMRDKIPIAGSVNNTQGLAL